MRERVVQRMATHKASLPSLPLLQLQQLSGGAPGQQPARSARYSQYKPVVSRPAPATSRPAPPATQTQKPQESPAPQVPITPAVAMKMYGSQLTPYEQSEILEYPQIYFTRHPASNARSTATPTNNNGFDDDRGDYVIVTHDHLAYRYEILLMLGKGSFGQVW